MIEAAEVSTGITTAVALQRGHYAGGITSETPLWRDCCGAVSTTLRLFVAIRRFVGIIIPLSAATG